jgi:hypothetical protein
VVYTAEILEPPVEFQNFKISIAFWFSTSQNGAFCQIVKKSLEFYALKNVKKKKTYSCILLKKIATAPAITAYPKKRSKKSILIFAKFFRFFVSGSSRRFESSQDSPFISEYWASYDPKPNGAFLKGSPLGLGTAYSSVHSCTH